ncbi:MAG: hypothetical protein ABIN58_06110 [candidate division WOR-3 bacterium]
MKAYVTSRLEGPDPVFAKGKIKGFVLLGILGEAPRFGLYLVAGDQEDISALASPSDVIRVAFQSDGEPSGDLEAGEIAALDGFLESVGATSFPKGFGAVPAPERLLHLMRLFSCEADLSAYEVGEEATEGTPP